MRLLYPPVLELDPPLDESSDNRLGVLQLKRRGQGLLSKPTTMAVLHTVGSVATQHRAGAAPKSLSHDSVYAGTYMYVKPRPAAIMSVWHSAHLHSGHRLPVAALRGKNFLFAGMTALLWHTL
jgi:hypothetical protein